MKRVAIAMLCVLWGTPAFGFPVTVDILLTPPLCITCDEIDEAVDRLDKVLKTPGNNLGDS